MVICGSYIFELSVGKDMKSTLHIKGGGSRENNGTCILNSNCQGIEI